MNTHIIFNTNHYTTIHTQSLLAYPYNNTIIIMFVCFIILIIIIYISISHKCLIISPLLFSVILIFFKRPQVTMIAHPNNYAKLGSSRTLLLLSDMTRKIRRDYENFNQFLFLSKRINYCYLIVYSLEFLYHCS